MAEVRTVTVQIGNSDNKLSQEAWSLFYQECHKCVQEHATNIHFAAASWGASPWQNACFVGEIYDERIPPMSISLVEIRERFNQDSVAVTYGQTQLI